MTRKLPTEPGTYLCHESPILSEPFLNVIKIRDIPHYYLFGKNFDRPGSKNMHWLETDINVMFICDNSYVKCHLIGLLYGSD